LLVIALFESKLEGVTTLWLLPVSSTCVLWDCIGIAGGMVGRMELGVTIP
jgi:hypothetical protein